MDLLITIILLLACLLLSNIISHYIPSIPTALTQIAFGVGMALLFTELEFEVKLEAEWFLLLFVAPLLYNDGRHFPRKELWKMRGSILGNAIVLVLLTTIIGGYFINWLIPSIPIAAAFALAAILSPTDPVAVNGIAKRIHIPHGVLNLVRGESLINDASGLVAFNYAVAAVVTGYFAVYEAIADFAYKFLVGALIGLLLSLMITWIRFILRKQGINDVTFHSLLQILTPFIIFLVAEELLHASGVIAVVVGGVVYSLVNERAETMLAEEQVLTENIWSIVIFILNGIVFLLLGLNIPSSVSKTIEDPAISNWLIIGYVLAIGIVILGIRFLWSYFFSHYEYWKKKTAVIDKPTIQHTLLVSLTGVRGAVTMAGVLSIPYITNTGAAFPERSLILFIAAGVILFTLIAATIFLPMLSPNTNEAEEDVLAGVKKKLMLFAIDKLYGEMNEENSFAAYELIDEYKSRIRHASQNNNSKEEALIREKVMEIRVLALKHERKLIQKLYDDHEIEEEMYKIFTGALDYREEALSSNFHSGTKFLFGKIMRGWGRFAKKSKRGKNGRKEYHRIGRDIQLQTLQATVQYLEQLRTESKDDYMVQLVELDYRRVLDRLSKQPEKYNERIQEQKEELRLRIVDEERSIIQQLYESGEINRDQSKELRRFVNYTESATLYEYVE
ncbi:Na+/H+ antiporter [Bacillus sp. B1-b2]|uniref:Na+/H+ antiporter n=1 Tax=Bacillus sp. B1-b2 TaxID=2653201 RepID=UPI001261CE03|nr:Na+/H+ antiporter [Bacillus sp. B1-b2]KAB7671784.1 Na+/H+ antiporter [Bacillus sp. B1-b2]